MVFDGYLQREMNPLLHRPGQELDEKCENGHDCNLIMACRVCGAPVCCPECCAESLEALLTAKAEEGRSPSGGGRGTDANVGGESEI